MNKTQVRVLALLRTKEWVSTTELCSPQGGANNGTRRVRELRELGYPIVRRHKAKSTDWEYSLIQPNQEEALF
jgi:transcription initiation factor IIE alpha subunit